MGTVLNQAKEDAKKMYSMHTREGNPGMIDKKWS